MPVIKVRSQACGLRADIVFSQPDGIESSKFIRSKARARVRINLGSDVQMEPNWTRFGSHRWLVSSSCPKDTAELSLVFIVC